MFIILFVISVLVIIGIVISPSSLFITIIKQETLSSIIQIYSIKRRGKKVFLMAPIHHHFEKLGWEETDIVKLFYLVGFGLGMVAVYYGVWL